VLHNRPKNADPEIKAARTKHVFMSYENSVDAIGLTEQFDVAVMLWACIREEVLAIPTGRFCGLPQSLRANVGKYLDQTMTVSSKSFRIKY
jgi:hypothetical protein